MADEPILNSFHKQYKSGMVRSTTEGKIDYTLVLDGPMHERWAIHLSKGAHKFGRKNWMLGDSGDEYARARESAFRHMCQWMAGEAEEDHAAAVFFNLNQAEYLKGKLSDRR